MPYYSGQGKLFVVERLAGGVKGKMRWVGNVPELALRFEIDALEHKESWSGARVTDVRITRENKAGVTFTIERFDRDNLALALWGLGTAVAGAAVTAEVLPTGLIVGDAASLAHPKVSAVTVKDSAGTPATVDAAHYTLDADQGVITILNLASYTQPFTVDYTYAGYDRVTMYTGAQPEVWLHFAGLNTADANKPVVVELYKVRLDPLNELGIINDELAQMQLEGSALADDTKIADTALGQFGRILMAA
jgi:hypothetical protein